MVAAATALCLDTNAHHRQGVFVAEQQHKMSLNFGAMSPRQLMDTVVTAAAAASGSASNHNDNNGRMDTLSVTNAQLRNVPQISPGSAALRRINEMLSLSTPSPRTPLSSSVQSDDSTPPDSNDEGSVQNAEMLKAQLMQAIEKNDFAKVGHLIDEIEAAHLTRKSLEVSRIGAVVNSLRRTIVNTHPDIARKCRSLVKSWRSHVEVSCSSRPESSCGSSSGTPALVSPAIRRGLTPRGKTVTPNSQLIYEGYSANASYAPSSTTTKISPQMVSSTTKRKNISPQANATASPAIKRVKISPQPTATPPQPISVIEARRNVQSTEQLLAALGMDKFLSSSVDTKPAADSSNHAQLNGLSKSDPIQVPSLARQSTEKRGRKKRDPAASGAETKPLVPRIKIRFGGKLAEEHDAEEVKKNDLANDVPSTSTDRQSVSKKSGKKSKEPVKPAFSWYDRLPSVEELEARSTDPPNLTADHPDSPTDPITWKYRERNIILMPYLNSDEPDFLHYDFPDKERFMAPRRIF